MVIGVTIEALIDADAEPCAVAVLQIPKKAIISKMTFLRKGLFMILSVSEKHSEL